jgi:hypothetical protein
MRLSSTLAMRRAVVARQESAMQRGAECKLVSVAMDSAATAWAWTIEQRS